MAGRAATQRSFFDRNAVLRSLGRTERRFLARSGAFIRQVARRSIRKRQRASRPGQAPSNRTGLLKQIYYSFDRGSRSVVVGPAAINGAKGDTPRLLEEGGTARRRLRVIHDGSDTRLITDRTARLQTVRYEPRPYMAPAYDAAAERRDRFWADAIR